MTNQTAPKLLIVIPCYNEEKMLPYAYLKIDEYFKQLMAEKIIGDNSRICLIDDGSKDQTWKIIEDICQENKNFIAIKLSTNFGHQKALLAGLEENKDKFDCYISIDADLQDDINVIGLMVQKYKAEGLNVIYGVRSKREQDSWFKRNSAQQFYKLIRRMKVPLIYNHADFRLIDNKMLNAFLNFGEKNLFIRGVLPSIGLKEGVVYYKRLKREHGETKYPLKKMISFAWEGITSFSTKPIRLVFTLSIFFFILSFLFLSWIIYSFFSGHAVAGWSSTLFIITFFSGINLISLGIIGEYVGKIYMEVKGRPRYIVEEKIEN